MASGEYIAVSTQRDTENALLAEEKINLKKYPKEEMQDLVSAYENDGLDLSAAKTVAREMTQANAFAVHADVDLHIDPNHLTNPWVAALASAGSFVAGAIIPMVAIMLPVEDLTVPVAFVAVIVALTITGVLSAKISGANVFKSTMRVVVGGAIAMIITYSIGVVVKLIGA